MPETNKLTMPEPLQNIKSGEFFTINDGFCYSGFAYQKSDNETVIVYRDGRTLTALTSNIIYLEPPMGSTPDDYSVTHLTIEKVLKELNNFHKEISDKAHSTIFPLSSIAKYAKKLSVLEQRIALFEKSPESIADEIPDIRSKYFAINPHKHIKELYLSSDKSHTESEIRNILVGMNIHYMNNSKIIAIPENQKYGSQVIERCKKGRGGPGQQVAFIPLEEMNNSFLKYII